MEAARGKAEAMAAAINKRQAKKDETPAERAKRIIGSIPKEKEELCVGPLGLLPPLLFAPGSVAPWCTPRWRRCCR